MDDDTRQQIDETRQQIAEMRQEIAEIKKQLAQIRAQMKGWRSVPITRIHHEIGFAYLAFTWHPELSSHKRPSTACVLENGVALPGPTNAPHNDIRHLGRGAYSFWHDHVFFSASDNSDPRTNGRRYEISYSSTTGSFVARVFYIVTNPFGTHVLLRWGNRIAFQVRQLPKTFLNTFWTMVYWSLFAWVLLRGRGKVK
jgi:hypothetical protein